MTAVNKNTWLLLLVFTVLSFQAAYSSIKTCNLYSNGPECVQHCGKTKPNGKEICSLSCKKNNGSAVDYCNQVCDPSDENSKKCSFHCDARKECVQQCTQGHCRHMKCARSRGYCEQYCTGGACKNMVCHSDVCFQNCRTGGCNMRCGPHVKYCEQVCTGGNCQITCEGKTCRAYCPTGTCQTHGPNSAIQTQCSKSGNQVCVQACDSNGCYCKSDSHYTECKQACQGETCRSIACHSKKCKQNCGSNCSLTCSAEECEQECSGSGCVFSCSGNVGVCRQTCKKGHCVFNCAAERCINDCIPTGTCTFNEIGDHRGSHLDAKCDYRHNGQCEPPCKDCVYGGKALLCTGRNAEKCDQKCLGGFCKNVKCSSQKSCTQNCPGGKCTNMDCRSKICTQRCSGSNCAMMKCTAQNCLQVCLGNCAKMFCNASECEQHCFLGNCNLECGSNVTLCRQTCYLGNCKLASKAKHWHRIEKCPDGICPAFNVEVSFLDKDRSTGSHVSATSRYLYSILIVLVLSMYI